MASVIIDKMFAIAIIIVIIIGPQSKYGRGKGEPREIGIGNY